MSELLPHTKDTLIFIKLGGSLITDKHQTSTPRMEMIHQLGEQIAAFRRENPSNRILLGHGSGSFGHIAAAAHGTRNGVNSPDQWRGFADVWKEASALNQLVISVLHQLGLPVIAFPPSASVIARDRASIQWDITPITRALSAGVIPVVYGDVIFDQHLGGTILSTEEVFEYLSPLLHPDRILIAGIEPGVWRDYPTCSAIIPTITPGSFKTMSSGISGSSAVDVTGGMSGKIQQLVSLIDGDPSLEILIFSATEPGALKSALDGQSDGTRLRS